jgi:hypothetical protein
MGDTWYTNLQVFLDENGAITAPKGSARKMAEHITSIVAMASRPELIPLPDIRSIAAGVLAENHAPELSKPITIPTIIGSFRGGVRSVMTADT